MSHHGASMEDLSRMTLLGQPFANRTQVGGENCSNGNGDAQKSSDDGEDVIKRADSGLYFEDDESDLVKDPTTPIAEVGTTRRTGSVDLRATSGVTNVLTHRIRERVSDWKEIAFTQLKFQMDEQAVKVSELKEEYVHSRKALVARIRAYTNR